MWQHIQNHPENSVPIPAAGIEKAENENYAFFMESTTIEYIIQKHCSLDMYGGLLASKGFGIAVRKGKLIWISCDSLLKFSFSTDAPTLRKVLSQAILKLQSSGKLAELKNKWWFEKNENICQVGIYTHAQKLLMWERVGEFEIR